MSRRFPINYPVLATGARRVATAHRCTRTKLWPRGQAPETQMASSEEKPVVRNHVEHFLAVRDRHGRVMIERDRAVRLRELQSRIVYDIAPDQELIIPRRNAHHSVAHGVTGDWYR